MGIKYTYTEDELKPRSADDYNLDYKGTPLKMYSEAMYFEDRVTEYMQVLAQTMGCFFAQVFWENREESYAEIGYEIESVVVGSGYDRKVKVSMVLNLRSKIRIDLATYTPYENTLWIKSELSEDDLVIKVNIFDMYDYRLQSIKKTIDQIQARFTIFGRKKKERDLDKAKDEFQTTSTILQGGIILFYVEMDDFFKNQLTEYARDHLCHELTALNGSRPLLIEN